MTTALLRGGDAAAITYDDGARLDPHLSPRPFVRATTRAGTPATAHKPTDHRHHLGLSLAIADVNGTSFWGGRTFVRGQGSTMLPNHGTQRVIERQQDDGRILERLLWTDQDGAPLFEEERVMIGADTAHGWELVWTSSLTAVRPISIGSPQTNGRDGAFYGGLFWRTPFESATVMTQDGRGTALAHGSATPWLALESADAWLVAATTTDMPWFVRTEGYVGFGPAVAVDERRRIDEGQTLHLDLAIALLDEAPSSAPAIAEGLLAGMRVAR